MPRFVDSLISLLVILTMSSCATSRTIDFDGVVDIATVPTGYQLVQNTGGTYKADRAFHKEESYYHISVSSESDLEELVREKGYAHLYYKLCDCGDTKCEPAIYSYYVLVDPTEHRATGSNLFYEVFIPRIIPSANYRNYEGPISEYAGETCLRLGAGNMAGMYLRTNEIRIEFAE